MTSPSRRPALLLLPLLVFCCLALSAFGASAAQGQATTGWVSGVGDDANPCSRTAPCRTLAGAISKTAEGGEINALDPGSYGAVTITKAITIDFTGVNGSVLHTAGNGITINAGADDDVLLRDVDVRGSQGPVGGPCPSYSGNRGIWVRDARSVTIQDVQGTNTAEAGVLVAPEESSVNVHMNRVDIANSCGPGVDVAPLAGRSASVAINDSSVSNAAIGVRVADGGTAWVSRSTIFGNGTGLLPVGGGTLNLFSDSHVFGNADNGTPTALLDPDPPGPPGPAGPAGAPGAPASAGQPAVKLLLVLPSEDLSARARRKVTLRYATSAPADAVLTVRRNGKVVARVRRQSEAGRNSITWNAKRRGTYLLTLSLEGADGQKVAQTATLKVRRR